MGPVGVGPGVQGAALKFRAVVRHRHRGPAPRFRQPLSTGAD
jgi:hypothetical protein